jgi:pimeloyl-ACP methyl ester carboxylesterase
MLFKEETVVASDGVRLFYRVAGEGPTTLLFLHGWAGSGSGPFWNRTLQYLDPLGLRLVLADLRGHGRSDHTRDGFTTERFAADMFEVADHVGAAKMVTVAYSMSGRWAQWMACIKPDRVLGQILFGPAPAVALPLTEETLDEWIRATATRGTWENLIGQLTRNRLSADTLDDFYSSVQTTPEHSLRESFYMCTRPGFVDRLDATTARTLVVVGTHDPLLRLDYVREHIVRRIPAARLALLDCGHEIPLELPRETGALIEAFVSGLG